MGQQIAFPRYCLWLDRAAVLTRYADAMGDDPAVPRIRKIARQCIRKANGWNLEVTGKPAAMTPTEITAAGFAVFKSVPIDRADNPPLTTTKNAHNPVKPWVIMGITGTNRAGKFVLGRYETYGEAVAVLHTELTDPDGSLNTSVVS